MNETGPDEEDGLREFAAAAMRPPRKGAFDTNVCHYLALSTSSKDPLRSIRLVTEAALLAKEDWERLGVEGRLVDVLHAVAVSLSEPTVKKFYRDPYSKNYEVRVLVGWSFRQSEDNYGRYVTPWWHGSLIYWVFYIHADFKRWWTGVRCKECNQPLFKLKHPATDKQIREKLRELNQGQKYTCPRCEHHHSSLWKLETEEYSEVVQEPEGEFFFHATSNATTEESFRRVVNQFVKWALPLAQDIKARLLGSVDKGEYRDILRIQRGEEEAEG